MGFKFRKTINLGNGFKINLSKSGIGYSFGVPGVRYSQSATGKKKMTYSIPGTGISYSNDISGKKKKPKQPKTAGASTNYEKELASNIELGEASNSDEFINAINDFIKKDRLIIAGIIIFSILLAFLLVTPLILAGGLAILGAYLFYREKYLKINIEYDFDDINAKYHDLMQCFLNEIASTKKLWLIDSKYKNSGICAGRTQAAIVTKVPYYLKTNISCFCLTIRDKEIYFLPDKVLVQDRNRASGIDFSELEFEFGETAYTEQEGVPKDSETAGYTYLHVNKKGEPDKRYKNNPKFPKCLYGTIDMKNNNGFNLSLMLSNKKKTEEAKKHYENMCNLSIRETKKCISCNEEISVDANFCKHCGAKQE